MAIFQIAQNYDGSALPLESGENKNITVGSPLAVIGLFVLALQHRFSPSALGTSGMLSDNPDLRAPISWEDADTSAIEPLPWIWAGGDLRPADECTPAGTRPPRPIFIGPAFDKNRGVRNYQPSIYVDRGNITVQKVANNNFVGQHNASGMEAFGAIARIPLQIDCVGENYGDSSIIGDTVWFYLLASRNILSRAFGFHQIVEPVLGATTPEETDKQIFHTMVFCDVELFLRWSTRPIVPLINDIVLRVAKAGSVDEVLVDIVLRESRS
jgi:hypothetical protein